MAYAVVRTDKMFGTDNRAGMASVKYMGSGSTATAIENGNVVKLDGLLAIDATAGTYEREIYKAVTPAASDELGVIALVASPEVMYDATKKDLAEFRNEAGEIARVYRLHHGDIFSVTADALAGTAEVGSVIELQAGTKLKAVSSATASTTTVGKCIEVAPAGRYTFYVIEVA